MKKSIIIVILILCLFLTSCMNTYEEHTLFKRRIVRTNHKTHSFGNYTSETTISQLLTTETRDSSYNFNENTKLVYDTIFNGTETVVTYLFDSDGKIDAIEYEFFFEDQIAEHQINRVYDECIKFLGYPDEGFTRKIYDHLYKSPSILWAKNNALLTLDFWIDDDLRTLGKFRYYAANFNDGIQTTFNLPFTISALGDRIDSVVSTESKNYSSKFSSVVGYSSKVDGEVTYDINYTFKSQYLKKVDMTYYTQNMNQSQAELFVKDILNLMYDEFYDTNIIDNSKGNKTSISFCSDDMQVRYIATDDIADNIKIEIEFYEILH